MSKIKLEVGGLYEDEMHDVWEIKRGNYKCFMAVNSSGVGRWYNDDGTCRGHSGKDSHYPKCNLVRKVLKTSGSSIKITNDGVFSYKIVAADESTKDLLHRITEKKTLAEELREIARNVSAITARVNRLKRKAWKAAQNGLDRIEIKSEDFHNSEITNALSEEGFTVERSTSMGNLSFWLSWSKP